MGESMWRRPVTERRWSAEFIAMLEALRMPTQFQQGRRYARAGHVRHLSVSASLAAALVLDEDGQAYRTKIAVRAFTGADWNRIERTLAGEARYAARLLAGQLPEDIDGILASFGLSLFPEGLAELAMDCACPAWQVPCRHLTATFYSLAESFDALVRDARSRCSGRSHWCTILSLLYLYLKESIGHATRARFPSTCEALL